MNIKDLYDMQNVEEKANNPFESKKGDILHCKIVDDIYESLKDNAQALKIELEISEFTEIERFNGFEVGFRTAMSLMMGGVMR